MNIDELKPLLPEFPRTKHLPIEPNAMRDDLIATDKEFEDLLRMKEVYVEEKVDGANSGITIYNNEPVLRNRNHILSKNYVGSKTPAKMQFSPFWNWFYSNRKKIEKIENELGYMPSIYGEWLYAQHSMSYDKLSDYFMVFDLYDSIDKVFLSPGIYHQLFDLAGIESVPLLYNGKVTEKILVDLRKGESVFSSTMEKEGIYIKGVVDGKIVCRYKMVRKGFIQGEHWNKKILVKNKLG